MTRSASPAKATKRKSGAAASRRKSKTEATRREIIRAAREVFSSYPYNAAGLRAIGQAGGFTHSFIRYHFKSKAGLFEAVAKELIEEYFQSAARLIQGLDGPLIMNTELLVERFVGFAFEHPEALDMILLNMGTVDQVKEAFPGMLSLRRFHVKTLEVFASSNYFSAPVEEVNRVFFCFSVILANCVGAARFFGKLIDINPDSEEYRRWVRDILVFLFYPSVKRLFFYDKEKPRHFASDPAKTDRGNKPAEDRLSPETTAVIKHNPSPAWNIKTPGNLPADTTGAALQTRRGGAKGRATRRRILAVARQVFARYPYNAAGIRMIGETGDFDFTLLYHYFPRKEELFEAVAEEMLEEYMASITSIIKNPNGMSMRPDMSAFIDNTMALCLEKPEMMKTCMQNIAQADKVENHPGFDVLARFLVETLRLFRETIPLPESDERVRMWMYGFGVVIFNCVGAPAYHARILGMQPGSGKYQQWIRETLMYVFYPGLKDLIFNENDRIPEQRH